MPRRKFNDKKNAKTYALVFRPQHDPLINDENAPDMVFTSVEGPNSKRSAKKIKTRADLEAEFGSTFRANEGEAANHGIYFDDTKYDYMQHLAASGGEGESHFIAAKSQEKGKTKQNLEDALLQMNIGDQGADLESFASSSHETDRRNYQSQQDVPDDIAGFQPDMDPRLREALEALEDDAYVDDEANLFAELTEGGGEVDKSEWEGMMWGDEEDDGWNTDDTIKASSTSKRPGLTSDSSFENAEDSDSIGAVPPSSNESSDWMTEFNRFKRAKAAEPATPRQDPAASEQRSTFTGTSSLLGGRRKKRKGALTSDSTYSMTSSSLARTDPLTTLDHRFDKLIESYEEDDYDNDDFLLDDQSVASGATGMSKMSKFSMASAKSTTSNASQGPTVSMAALEGMVDDFIDSHVVRGNRGRVIRGQNQTPLEELDQLRRDLGSARLRKQEV